MRFPSKLSVLLLGTLTRTPLIALAEEHVCTIDGTCIGNEHGTDDEPALWKPALPKCGLYMGPSTLGGDTNLGMYAGQDIPNNVNVQREIAIPLQFRDWESPIYKETDDGQLWDRYIWEGPVANLETYDNTNTDQSKAVFVPGIGCTINSILDLHNVESTHGSTYDTVELDRTKDPGSGAFTPYHSTQTVSTEFIPAGSEIFASYGDQWIPDIPGAQVTFLHVLEKAEQFLRESYFPFLKAHESKLKPNVMEGLWKFTRDFPLTSNPTFTVLPRQVKWAEIHPILEDAIDKQAFDDEDEDEFGDYLDDNTSEEKTLYPVKSLVTRHFIRTQAVRTLEWLEKKCRCSDHIRPGRSTIEQAGRGAFANRDLPEGTIVGYSPLVHVGIHGPTIFKIPYGKKDRTKPRKFNEDGERMYDEEDDDDDDEEVDMSVLNEYEDYEIQDLVINYSFRHRESSLTLTPYGSMVNYINHQGKDKANVKLVWPKEELVAHKPDWLNRDVDTLRHTIEKIGLSLDYVATRDIKEGEEIFLDYGEEWEHAWEKHVKSWKAMPEADKYMHSTDWPEEEPYRTAAELETNPYPYNLETMCVESYQQTADEYAWLAVLRASSDRTPCVILDRKVLANGMAFYTVEMEIADDEDDEDDEDEETKTIVVHRVPHDWVFLVDKVRTADWHMPNTFRHTIAIPDDIMPDAWKNRKASSKK